jgi:hypothetical protein
MNGDGITRGWITLNPNELRLLASASKNDTSGTLYDYLTVIYDHFTTLYKRDRMDHIPDDKFYDPQNNMSIISLGHVEFSMGTRLIPHCGTAYERFELSNGRTVYREYPYSYIIITRGELDGICPALNT